MQCNTQYSFLSIHPFVTKQKKLIHILIPYKTMFTIHFQHDEWLVGDDPFYLKFWAKLTPF